MKHFTLFSLCLALTVGTTWAQDETESSQETLLGGGVTSSGGYGGSWFQYGAFHGQAALFTGGFGGWFANQKFTIGGGGLRLATGVAVPEADRLDATQEMTFENNFGGLYLAYTFNSNKVIHPEVSMMAGSGGVWQRNEDGDNFGKSSYAFLMPGASIDFNVIHFMRIGVGANYRVAFGSNTQGITDGQLGGPSGFVTLKFGYFGQ